MLYALVYMIQNRVVSSLGEQSFVTKAFESQPDDDGLDSRDDDDEQRNLQHHVDMLFRIQPRNLNNARSNLFAIIRKTLRNKTGFDLHISLGRLLTRSWQVYSQLYRTKLFGQAVEALKMFHLIAVELEHVHLKV